MRYDTCTKCREYGGGMVESGEGEVTQLLARFRAGDREAESRLVPLVYGELRRLARMYLSREQAHVSLQPTALVHEAFLRLAGDGQPEWQNRAHFFAISARVMRQILVDRARRRGAFKRGGSRQKVELQDAIVFSEDKSEQLIALDQALSRLAQQDERQSQIVEMKFFGGLSTEDIARVLHLSPRTVKRDWMVARAWLHKEITR